MPNIKSAKKRVLVAEKKKVRNRTVKSQVKTGIKKFEAAVTSNNLEAATTLLPVVSGEIDKAASKGIIHKNTANRKKARLAIKLNKASSN